MSEILNSPAHGVEFRAQDLAGSANVRSIELATFLRGRRAALLPEDVGLRPTGRRRTPGLRREEVAELANISTSLYTWLEQGRDVAASKRTIDAVANALRLSPAQRRHLHSLASPQAIELDETVSPALLRLIASMRAQPAFVLDHAWDVLASNAVMAAVFGSDALDASQSKTDRHNFLEHIFFDSTLRANCVDWEGLAAKIVALFRFQFASYTADARSIAVVENLRARSPLFAAHWEEHRIYPHPHGLHAYNHPKVGLLTFEPTTYAVVESTGLRLLIYCPADEATTTSIEKLLLETPEPAPVECVNQ